MSRLIAYGWGLTLLALVIAPAFHDPDDDSYPLSTYPMFARERGKPWLDFAEGTDARGQAVHLEPSLLGSDEVMQSAASVRAAIARGPLGMAPFCAEIAARVAEQSALSQVTEVRLVGARFDPVRYFVEGRVPEQQVEHFHCAVTRSK